MALLYQHVSDEAKLTAKTNTKKETIYEETDQVKMDKKRNKRERSVTYV